MKGLLHFTYEGKPIRVLDQEGKPWWVARDVCLVLDIDKHRDAVSRLDADERGSVLVDTLGGPQLMAAVNEPGLYSLILRSRRPEAKAFKRWITHEVLPQIRKTGQYAAPMTDDELMARAVLAADKRIRALQGEVKVLTPKAEAFERLMSTCNTRTIREVAKVLGTGQNRLFQFLRERGVLMPNNEPYQRHVDAGRFEVRVKEYEMSGGQTVSYTQTRVTAQGMDYIRRMLDAEKENGLVLESKKTDPPVQ